MFFPVFVSAYLFVHRMVMLPSSSSNNDRHMAYITQDKVYELTILMNVASLVDV